MIKYVLITPAWNEAENLVRLFGSVASQTHLPEKWIIVDDGSTDQTPTLAANFAREHPWVKVINKSSENKRNFAKKVHAFNTGYEEVRGLDFEVIGNLDADLSFDPEYLEFLMRKFEEDPDLGVAGTPFTENGYDSARDSFEGENHVAGGCQLFRRKCFEDIGGYIPNREGGIDWIAVTTARMRGWRTKSFIEKRFMHYRPLGTAERSAFKAEFSYGEKDYYLGNSPIWQIFRFAYRTIKNPLKLSGLALFLGYLWASIRRVPRPVSDELMRFHRNEQSKKLRIILKGVFQLKKADNFELMKQHDSSN